MNRLIIVSNRLPVTVTRNKRELVFTRSAGGLATGLGSIYKDLKSIWIGWPGINEEDITDEEKKFIANKLETENCYPVFLTREEVGLYYYGFCNKTIWPLFHYFYLYMEYDEDSFEAYKRINKKFCDVVASVAQEDDLIWVHDYHLMLAPRMLREKLEDATIGFFLHIPFPAYEVYRLLPRRTEIIQGLLGADLIGFHTYDYALHFINTVTYLLGYEHSMGEIEVGNRIVKVDAFPMGIDYYRFASSVNKPRVKRELSKLKRTLKDKKLILSVDRLDYTKGILHRLQGFELFLENNPQFLEKVILLMVAVPTRTGVEHYMNLKREVEETVGRINGRFGTVGWTPIWYLYRSVPFETLCTMYAAADVALVTPLRDGMNLVAKEYLATKDSTSDGVLVLSEFAGAAKELGEAILVNPNDVVALSQAIKLALEMPPNDKIEKNRLMQERLKRYTVKRWASDFIETLIRVSRKQKGLVLMRVNRFIQEDFRKRFMEAQKRLLLLDYDGTLVPFADRPEKAVPDYELKDLLKKLSEKSLVVIISGRNRRILDQWFGDLDIGLVAEHGVWIKEPNSDWKLLEPVTNQWMDQIRPILELFVDRTPGSFIEEKEFALAWHYRKADPELATVRARELKGTLMQLAINLNLDIIEGNKVLEIRNANINKGKAALYWMSKDNWDFLFSAGDDWTDEDMFQIMPETAITVKVGATSTKAKYIVESYKELRKILKEFVEKQV
ncbi:alpha,alpha-trehalose-phosphate synthase (UDP-forming) [Thermosulfidibacter takaii ABI70S6]|uniref:Alpha,alpha-trehalose-phosphate synthase n=1 Tax=Thermosulfidibacter takaii (strain DSM 17441 / JCM 13301 / NBRC 103674 / ABI70S6) TaxID=1298851 RepID=A0A0S3QTI8_THET7|nr:bifunctional alpha,alpha-trehalose-phosphate synthase (UDP-forming)/trehalose-phosphatase [Thermosulfidibacter takaii]BAT71635.1 alpha,alpha-trehalose-phosphate synthase (UDP-forming) [Thermosulfidibacter takaii ABI70S6]